MADYRQSESLEEQLRRERRMAGALRRRRRLRWLIPLLLVLALIAGLFAYFYHQFKTNHPDTPVEEVSDGKAVLAAVGDISLNDDMLKQFRSGEDYDFSGCFQWVTAQIASSDLAVGNLEGNIGDVSGATGTYPASLLTALRECGFDVLQTANSFSIQNGITGLQKTNEAVRAAGMEPLGTFLSKEDKEQSGGILIKEVNGIRFALIGLTKGMNNMKIPDGEDYCVNLLYSDYDTNYSKINQGAIVQLIENAKAQDPDVILAMIHWGSEFTEEITDSQKRIAKLLFENGVDVIIGSHSHIVGQMHREQVNSLLGKKDRGFVAYSLGDFLSSADDSSARIGCVLHIEFTKTAGTTRISDISYIPTYMSVPSADLETRSYEILDTINAISLYDQEYYDRVSEPLYDKLISSLEKLQKQTESEYQKTPDTTAATDESEQ